MTTYAPNTSQYVLINNDPTNLPNAQALAVGSGLQITSSGPAGNLTISPSGALQSLQNLNSQGFMTFLPGSKSISTTALSSDTSLNIQYPDGVSGSIYLSVNPRSTPQLIAASGNGGSSVGTYPLLNFIGPGVSVTSDPFNNRINVSITEQGIGSVTSVELATPNNTLSISGTNPITTSGIINVDLETTAVTPGSYTNADITVDAYGRITAASSGSEGGGVTSVATGTGLTGGPITSTGTISIANTSVSPGSYTNASITVNAQGQITAASSGSEGGVTSITGTANQINVSSTTGDVVVSFPDNILVNILVASAIASNSVLSPVISVADGIGGDPIYILPSTAGSPGQTITWPASGDILIWEDKTAGSVTSVTASSPLASSGGQTPNITLNSAVPIILGGTGQTTASAAFDAIAPTTTTGDIIYYNGSTNARLPIGSNGQVLAVSSSGEPEWITDTGTGTVTSITAGTGLSGGTITTSGTISIANTSVSPGSYTNASITVNAQGQITAASNGSEGGVTSITGTANQINVSSTTGDITLSIPSGANQFILPNNLITSSNAWASVAIGVDVLETMTGVATGNVGVGGFSLQAVTEGQYNIGMGIAAGYNLTTANNDILIGYHAGYEIETSTYNIGIGSNSLANLNGDNSTTNNNIGVGHGSLSSLENGIGNIGVGNQALQGLATGTTTYNTAIGHQAGNTLQEGNFNLFLGNFAQPTATTISNQCVIGGNSSANWITSLNIPGMYLNYGITVPASSPNPAGLTLYADQSQQYTFPITQAPYQNGWSEYDPNAYYALVWKPGNDSTPNTQLFWAQVIVAISTITGTANEITAVQSGTDVTLSLPWTLIAPGSFQAMSTIQGTEITGLTSITAPTISATTSMTAPTISATTSFSSPIITGTTSITTPLINITDNSTYNYSLPTSNGTLGQALISAGGGSLTWENVTVPDISSSNYDFEYIGSGITTHNQPTNVPIYFNKTNGVVTLTVDLDIINSAASYASGGTSYVFSTTTYIPSDYYPSSSISFTPYPNYSLGLISVSINSGGATTTGNAFLYFDGTGWKLTIVNANGYGNSAGYGFAQAASPVTSTYATSSAVSFTYLGNV